jgi:heat shock protein HslJ
MVSRRLIGMIACIVIGALLFSYYSRTRKVVRNDIQLQQTEWIVDEIIYKDFQLPTNRESYDDYIKHSISFNQSLLRNDQRSLTGMQECNSFSGTYTTYENNMIELNISSITEMGCGGRLSEGRLSEGLDQIERYRIEPSGGEKIGRRLILEGKEGVIRLVLLEVIEGQVVKKTEEGVSDASETQKNPYTLQLTKGTDMDQLLLPNFINDSNYKKEFEYWNCKMINLRINHGTNQGTSQGTNQGTSQGTSQGKTKEQKNGHIFVTCDAFKFEPIIAYGRPILNDSQEKLLSKIIINKEEYAPNQEWNSYQLSHRLKQSLQNLGTNEKRAFVDHWLEIAQHEHSSIASFSQVILELMSFGAPQILLHGCQEAMMDETKHARIALSLASNTQSPPTPYTFGQLDQITIIPRTITQFKDDNYRNACIGEAESAKQLFNEAENTTIDGLKDILLEIASDESKHAELGWEIDRWIAI